MAQLMREKQTTETGDSMYLDIKYLDMTALRDRRTRQWLQ